MVLTCHKGKLEWVYEKSVISALIGSEKVGHPRSRNTKFKKKQKISLFKVFLQFGHIKPRASV